MDDKTHAQLDKAVDDFIDALPDNLNIEKIGFIIYALVVSFGMSERRLNAAVQLALDVAETKAQPSVLTLSDLLGGRMDAPDDVDEADITY